MKHDGMTTMALTATLILLPACLFGGQTAKKDISLDVLFKEAANRINGSAGDRQSSIVALRRILNSPHATKEMKLQAAVLEATTHRVKTRDYTSAISSYTEALKYAVTVKDIVEIKNLTAVCYIAQRAYALAIKDLESIRSELKTVSPILGRQILYRLAGAYEANGERAKGIECWETILNKELVLTMSEGYDLTWRVASLYIKSGDLDRGVAFARQGVKDYPLITVWRQVGRSIAIASAFAKEDRPADAVSELESALEKHRDADPKSRVLLYCELAAILEGTAKDIQKAEAQYRAAINIVEKERYPETYADAGQRPYIGLAGFYHRAGRKKEASSVLLTCLDQCGESYMAVAAAVNAMIDYDTDKEAANRACSYLQKNIAGNLSSTVLASSAQTQIVRLLTQAGRHQDALQECRVLLYTCPHKSIPGAIDLMAFTLKAADKNLRRANQFLMYQKFGPVGVDEKLGTDDDLRDVLAEIPTSTNQERDKRYRATLESLPKNWVGHRQRSMIHQYLDQPAEALRALEEAFAACPINERDLQLVTNALTDLIVRRTKDVRSAELLVKYLMFGTEGEDGHAGTQDDIKNPVADIKKQLIGDRMPTAGTHKPISKSAPPRING